MPKATSSPSISDDQKERMIRNRKLAEERRLARLKQNSMDTSGKQDSVIIEVDEEVEINVTAKKQHKSYVIDSSDDECDVTSVNQSVTVDIHNDTKKSEEIDDKVVLEAEENLEDIEMEENVDKNRAQEVTLDVVEIIDDADKDIGRNVSLIHDTEKDVEIIEINDQTGKIIETKKVVDGVIEIDDQSNQGATEIVDNVSDGIIEINDLVTTDIVKETSISNAIEVIKENDNTSTVNVNTGNGALTSEVVILDKSNENKSKSPLDNDSIQNENIHQDDANLRDVGDLENNANVAVEVIKDVMDVDFSDDF